MFTPNPGTQHQPITPSDSTIYVTPFKAVWVGGTTGAQTITIIDPGGVSATYTIANAPCIIPVAVQKVMLTGTTVTNIIGFKE